MRFASSTNTFLPHGQISHRGSVQALAVSDDSKLLATGGSKGTFIWRLENGEQLKSPGNTPTWGSTTSIAWSSHPDQSGEVLAFGTQSGHIVFWRQNHKNAWEEIFCSQIVGKQEITGLAFDAGANRLVVATRGGILCSLRLDSATPQKVFAIQVDFIPIAIAHGAMMGDVRTVIAFDQLGGRMAMFNGNTGAIETQKNLGRLIGDVDLNVQKGVFAMDDSAYGVALYRLDSGILQKTFPVPNKVEEGTARPRQVCLTDCGAVVSGSDHGIIYIFDRKSGETIDELTIDLNKSFQAVGCAKIGGATVILTGKSRGDVDGENPVYLFKKSSGLLEKDVQLSALNDWMKTFLQMLGGMLLLLLLLKSGVVQV